MRKLRIEPSMSLKEVRLHEREDELMAPQIVQRVHSGLILRGMYCNDEEIEKWVLQSEGFSASKSLSFLLTVET